MSYCVQRYLQVLQHKYIPISLSIYPSIQKVSCLTVLYIHYTLIQVRASEVNTHSYDLTDLGSDCLMR